MSAKAWLENSEEGVSCVGLSLPLECTAKLERDLRTLFRRSAMADIDLLLDRPLLRGEVASARSEGASEDCMMISMTFLE